ncbi:MAG: PAS domain S-box protein, partial [Desulfobulbaceae bacterium]|nr:PAS domain S-box protein [Desulfobulbaceae bacterium]
IGPHGHYCVPILNADQALLGVFTVYTRDNHLRDAKTEEVLAAAANIMAGIIERHTVQDALHQSREQYRSLVENLENTYFFYSYNPNGMLTYLSPSITKILGYSQQEFMGNYHAYLTDNQANQSLAAHMAISLRGEKQPPYLLELLHKDGMRKWLEIYENPIMGEGGEVVAVEGLANDVTVKIINESALRRTNKQLEKIFETTLFFIAYLDRAFNFIRVNRAYADASACSPDSFVGKNHFDLYPNEENQRIFEEVVATGVPYTVHAKPFEYPDQPERGVTYWDWALYPIKGMDGAVEFLILALVDVTLTKRHELELKQHRDQLEELVQKRTAALLESEEQVRLLLNSTAEAIYGFDRNGNCTFCNPACLRMLGYADQQDLLGKNIHEVIHHTRSDGTPYPIEECNFHKVYELGEPAHVEDELLWKKDGSSFPVEIWSYPIIKRDEVLGVVVTFIDITDRKNKEMEIERTLAALEKARRDADLATKAKSNFLANMSHEIRTPMNAIIGLAHLAQQTELSLKQRDYLQKIDISAKSLLGIINDILDFSKIEADKLTMESVDFYLDNVLANVVNTVSYKVKENGLILRTNISEDLPFNLKGDPLRLNQILANLLSNAVKFTGKGEVVIDIALEETRGDLVKLRFSVKDTGIGLNTEQIKGLFQAFNQADTSTTRMYGGTGLGLAICKKLINMMNGNIWVKSVPKEGSTFLFTAEFKRQVQPSQEIAIYSQELQGSHVLIGIEDEMTRRFLRKAIESYALIVDAVSRGEDVVAELRRYGSRKLYSLLILDGKMSGMSGLETVKRIKELPNSVSMSQVIMLINADGYAIQQAAEKEGLDNFLMKPVIRTRLINALLKGLGKKSVAPQSADLNKISEGNIHVIAGARILLVEDNTINQQVARELLESVGLKVTIAENGKEGVRLA